MKSPAHEVTAGVQIQIRIALEASCARRINGPAAAARAAVEARELPAGVVARGEPVVRSVLVHNLPIVRVENVAVRVAPRDLVA